MLIAINRIQEAGKIPRACVSMNRDLVRDHVFKMSDMDGVLARKVRLPLEPHCDTHIVTVQLRT